MVDQEVSAIRTANMLAYSRCGDQAAMDELLNLGCSVNCTDDEDVTPLQVTAANGYVDVSNWLISLGASVDMYNNYGWTPLLHAAYYGHSDMVKLLIDRDCDIEAQNRYETGAVALACRDGHVNVVQQLLSRGAPVNSRVLHVACAHGHVALVEYLLTHLKIDVNAAMEYTGVTPLMMAARCGNLPMVELLINHGADPDALSTRAQCALDYCSSADVHQFLKPLTTVPTRKVSMTILDAVEANNVQLVKSMLQADPSLVNFVGTQYKTTPLMQAAMQGQMNIVSHLLKLGADINKQDRFGWTALMRALYADKFTVAKFLVGSGADVSVLSLGDADAGDGERRYTAYDIALSRNVNDEELLSKLRIRKRSSIAERSPKRSKAPWWKRFSGKFKKSLTRTNSVASLPTHHSPADARTRSMSLGLHQQPVLVGNSFFKKKASNRALSDSNYSMDLIGAESSGSDDNMVANTSPVSKVPVLLPQPLIGPRASLGGKRNISRPNPLVVVPPCSMRPPHVDGIPPTINAKPCVDMVEVDENDALVQPSATDLWGRATMRSPLSPIREDQPASPAPHTVMSQTEASTPNQSSQPNPVGGLQRSKRPPPLIGLGNTGPPPYRATGTRTAASRPHSYHDAAGGVARSRMAGAFCTLPRPDKSSNSSLGGTYRPQSLCDRNALDAAAIAHLPVTPTRRTVGFFTSSSTLNSSMVSSGSQSQKKMAKFASTPMLLGNNAASPNSSSGGSSSLTPNKRMFLSGASLAVPASSLLDVSSSVETLKLEEDEMQKILNQLALTEYQTVFEEEEVDLESFLMLTDADLRDLGIKDPEARNGILLAVRQLNFALSNRRSGQASA